MISRIALLSVLALAVTACGGSSPTAPSANVPYSQNDLLVGSGAEAANGRLVTVNYTGWLYDASISGNKGAQFDSSLTPGRTPFSFVLGASNVIQGWHQGVAGMRVGGRRRLILPPNLGYGSQGSPPQIPGNSTLIFEIEVLAVQ